MTDPYLLQQLARALGVVAEAHAVAVWVDPDYWPDDLKEYDKEAHRECEQKGR